jgi:hypothetical protein
MIGRNLPEGRKTASPPPRGVLTLKLPVWGSIMLEKAMKPFLFSHGEKEASGARELSAAELDIVAGGDDMIGVGGEHTQIMTAPKDPNGTVVRDGYDG